MKKETAKKIASEIAMKEVEKKVKNFYRNNRKRKKPLTDEEVAKELFEKDKKTLKKTYKKIYEGIYNEVLKIAHNSMVLIFNKGGDKNIKFVESEAGIPIYLENIKDCSSYLKKNNFLKSLFANEYEIKKRNPEELNKKFKAKGFINIKPFETIKFGLNFSLGIPDNSVIRVNSNDEDTKILRLNTYTNSEEEVTVTLYNSTPVEVTVFNNVVYGQISINPIIKTI